MFIVLYLFLIVTTHIDADFSDPICKGWGTTCLDCYTQKFCMGETLWSKNPCKNAAGTNKDIYCNPTTFSCTSTPPSVCISSEVVCPQPNGIFPDISNCSKYLECKNNTITFSSCPSDYIYNEKFGKCVLQLEDSDCLKITCSSSVDGIYLYPNNPSLYYQCTSGKVKLYSCPENNIYDVASKKCQTICKNVTLIANPKNCLEYISCEAQNSSFVPIKKSCAKGYGFNPISNKCEKGLSKLCYEISNFRNSLLETPSVPNFLKRCIQRVIGFFGIFGVDISLLLSFGVPENVVAALLSGGNYFITHNYKLPPLLLNNIVKIILNLLPANLRTTVELALSLIFRNSEFT